MKIITLTPAAVLVAFAGLTLPGSPAADPTKGPTVDTSFLKLYAETRGFMLGRPQKPKITPDGKAVLFLRAEPKTPKLKLYEFDVATGQTKELLSPELLLKGGDENLTPEEKARRERQRVTVGGFADFSLDPSGERVLVKLANKLYVFERTTGRATPLRAGDGGAIVDPKWSPDGKLIGYVRGFDVYAYDLAAGRETAVTTGGTEVKTHGLAEFVAQEEMHRHSGFWWSPDSRFIAYEEADHTGVERWYVADPYKPGLAPTAQYYPRPGGKNVTVRLGVVPVTGGPTVWADWDRAKFEYLAGVRWDPVGPLTVILQDRAQREQALMRVEPATGKLTQLRRERVEGDPAWLNLPRGDLPRWRADGKSFLWAHPEEDGTTVRFFDADGKPQDLAAFWTPHFVREIVGFDATTGRTVGVLVRGTGLSDPAEARAKGQPFKPDPNPTLASLVEYRPGKTLRDSAWKPMFVGNPQVQFGDTGALSAVFNDHLALCVITDSTIDHMPRSTMLAYDGDQMRRIDQLPSVAVEPPFTPNVTIQKAGDYWTGVVRPRDFDPKKKYPVVVFVYGGPTSLVVTQAMQPWLVRQWLADQGFVVVAIDNRGTPGRGRDWEKAVYQKFGTVPLEDQVKGLAALCDKFPELDRERVGLVGWSFGGYMAANGVLRRPDVFKAAVAGAPVTDWADYDTHYTERYMGLLPESQAAYDEASLIPLAKDLSRPLLLVHGTADDNVYFRHTLKLTDALVRAGRDFEVLPLPGVTHMYTSDPTVTERLWSKSAAFFKRHLGEPK